MDLTLAYDQPTALTITESAAWLRLAANRRRTDARFHGRVRDPLRLRQMLLAFHAALTLDVRSQSGAWLDGGEWRQTPDPIVSIYPDQIAWEAFSNDGSCYARLTMPMSAFSEVSGAQPGVTSVDFSWDLRQTLRGLRGSRDTLLVIGGAGMNVGGGAAQVDGFTREVSVPDAWVKGFLQVQGALTMRPFSFPVKPVDLLSAMNYLDEHFPPGPPHGLRYVFTPDAPITLVLEPWEERFTLRGTRYTGYPRTVRVWGRKRLALLREALPYADRVTVAVLGRGLPHVYILHSGPYQFMLALSGWAANDWATGGNFDLLAPQQGGADQAARVHAYLTDHLDARASDIAAQTGMPEAETQQALFTLCRGGRVLFDLVNGRYRLRELFATPVDVAALFSPDTRLADAQRLADDGKVALNQTRRRVAGRNETRVTATVADDADYAVTIAMDDQGRLKFGQCECAFFRANLMAQGPCAHMLAARIAFDTAALAPTPVAAGGYDADDNDDDDDDDDGDEE